jgi:hypothetical protein
LSQRPLTVPSRAIQQQGAVISNVPDGAQLSDDGNYWWDGNQWQPVNQEAGGAGQSANQSGGAGGGGASHAQDWIEIDSGAEIPDGFGDYISNGMANTGAIGWGGCTPCIGDRRLCYGTIQELEARWGTSYDCTEVPGSHGHLWWRRC